MVSRLATILIVASSLLLSSCMSIKTAQKKVLNDRQASEEVFNTMALTHPCANDTTFISRMDTLTMSDTIYDYRRDTVDRVITLTELGKTIVKTVKVHDVQTSFIVDTRMVKILSDSLSLYKTSLIISNNNVEKYKHRFVILIQILVIIILIYAIIRALKPR